MHGIIPMKGWMTLLLSMAMALPVKAASDAERMVAELLGATAAPPAEAQIDIPLVTGVEVSVEEMVIPETPEHPMEDIGAEEPGAQEQAAREQAAEEETAREQAALEEAAQEQVAREQAAREEAAREDERPPHTVPGQDRYEIEEPEPPSEEKTTPAPEQVAEAAEEEEVVVDTAVQRERGAAELIEEIALDEEEVSVYPAGSSPEPEREAAAGAEPVEEAETAAEVEAPTAATVTPGTLAGKVTDHAGRPLSSVKVVLFTTNSYKEMKSTPGGNFGFSIVETNEYTLTAEIGNQFYYTNLFLVPARGTMVVIPFKMAITVYGKLLIDGRPAQHGLFLRLIGEGGGQAGGIVVTNGLFRVTRLTPGKYTMVFERRKRFIDRRLNESRFYYVPVTLTSETVRIAVTRDRRRVVGNVILDGLPRRCIDALVIFKDARTGGMLIHREAYTYYREGYFVFDNVLPGKYTLQAVQNQREWKSSKILVIVKPRSKSTKVVIDVTTDKFAAARRLQQLRRQFLAE